MCSHTTGINVIWANTHLSIIFERAFGSLKRNQMKWLVSSRLAEYVSMSAYKCACVLLWCAGSSRDIVYRWLAHFTQFNLFCCSCSCNPTSDRPFAHWPDDAPPPRTLPWQHCVVMSKVVEVALCFIHIHSAATASIGILLSGSIDKTTDFPRRVTAANGAPAAGASGFFHFSRSLLTSATRAGPRGQKAFHSL